jgi:Ca-activated chloride channel family protein
MYSDSARLSLRCLLGRVQRFLSLNNSRHSTKIIFFATFLVCSQMSIRAQDDVVTVRTDLVLVPARVTDRSRKPVTNIRREDFELLVDGKPIKPDFFSTGSPSVNLLFLLDQSGSVRETIARQTDAARQLFMRFGPHSSVAVVRFDEQPHLISGFAESDSAMPAGFVFPAEHDRRTAIFDSVAESIRFFDVAQRRADARKLIILISDGLDTVSRARVDDVISRAQNSGITIYALQIATFVPDGNTLRPRPPTKGFKDLGEKTGGAYFLFGDKNSALDPSKPVDLSRVFDAIERDLSSQYLLGFYPPENLRDSQDHRIDVNVVNAGQGKLRVQPSRRSFRID